MLQNVYGRFLKIAELLQLVHLPVKRLKRRRVVLQAVRGLGTFELRDCAAHLRRVQKRVSTLTEAAETNTNRTHSVQYVNEVLPVLKQLLNLRHSLHLCVHFVVDVKSLDIIR